MRLLWLLMLAVLDCVVNVRQNDPDRFLVGHVQRQKLDHVEVLDLRDEHEPRGVSETACGGVRKEERGEARGEVSSAERWE